MKKLYSFILLVVALGGCATDSGPASSDSDYCIDGQHRCTDNWVMSCEDSHWAREVDCTEVDLYCATIADATVCQADIVDTGSDADADADSDTDTDADTDTDTDSDSDADADSDSDSDTDADTDADSDSEVDTDTAPPEYIEYPFTQMDGDERVYADWTPILNDTWKGIKKRNIDAYSVPLVHRPKSEEPDDAVSEGVGYGMLVALFSNDQAYFNKIWGAGEDKMWNGYLYNWRCNERGDVIGENAATDADEDIAMALIFADHLVKQGIWQDYSHNGTSYYDRAQSIVTSIWDNMIHDGRYVVPGNAFGAKESLNPGYFAPAWYRIFDDFDQWDDHNWGNVIDQCYTSIEANPGYDKGLLPDWMDAWGNLLAEGPGYNAYDNGQSMFKDGIRVYWRLATDAIWFNEPRARKFLNNAMTFLEEKASSEGSDDNYNSPAHLANFYKMNGSQVPKSDMWDDLAGGTISRSRNEHSHLTIGMWAAAAMGAGDLDVAERFSRELLLYYEGGDTWGLTTDPNGNDEDQEHNELYFDQFLAWFGAAILNGSFCNLKECVK